MTGETHYPPIGSTRLRSNSLGVMVVTLALLSGSIMLVATQFQAAAEATLLLGGGAIAFGLLWRAGWLTGTVVEHTRDPEGRAAIRVRGRDGVEVLQPVHEPVTQAITRLVLSPTFVLIALALLGIALAATYLA